ncbi:MAG: hypothetical protein LIP01_14910 [Tannerellaceae bacterium]|nr:hypothetical protein [Tannerellaceae bacterium]
MRHFLLYLLFLLISIGGYAQKIHRNYSFYPQESGNVYFIHPQKGYISPDKNAVKGLEYDITYISGKDSATINFTYFTNQVLQARTIRLQKQTGDVLYEAPLVSLFVQPRKNYWQQRMQFLIPYALLSELYKQSEPFLITLSGGREIRYEIKPGSWKKQAELINKVFEVVEYNR